MKQPVTIMDDSIALSAVLETPEDAGCTSLAEVTLPRALEKGDYAFSGCSSLATVQYAEGITKIPDYLLRSCP